jgi:tetratricopeptide (TPR) repeat protein
MCFNMKKSTMLFVVVGATISATYAQAQQLTLLGADKWADSAAREIDVATQAGDIARLHRANALLDRALTAFPGNALLLHYQGYSLFREAGLLSGKAGADKNELPLVLRTAQTKLEQSLAAQPLAETHALLANILGQEIGLDASTGPTLGPRVQQEMTAALNMGASNPRVWLLRGIQSIYTPAEYGGGLTTAESHLNKAVALFVTDRPSPPTPSWGRAEAYAWLGQVLQKENRKAEARTAYRQALAIQKDYAWVTYTLLPSLDK